MRIIPICTFLLLAACGGGGGGSASGPVGSACSASSRDAANPQLCACVQRVASNSLSYSEQKRAATFFADPDLAQATRTRDDASSEAFWRRYKAFSERAAATCG